jgi:hypothetical protein
MSYIINKTNPFVSVKVTEKGREMLAKGLLNFTSWAIGDSEINYEREVVLDANPSDITLSGSTTKVLKPKDVQHNIKYFINDGSELVFNPLTNSNIKTLKLIVNNQATTRGFFSGDTVSGFTTLTGSPYDVITGFVADTEFTGTNSIDLGVSGLTEGDFILFKITNDTLGNVSPNSNTEPIPHLWYKIQSISGTTIEVDRLLPNLNGTGGTQSQFIVYQNGEVYETIGEPTTTSYWNTNTLSFDSNCDVSCSDVPVWNINNVFCENPAGITGDTYESFIKFGSYDYLGQKYPFLEYICENEDVENPFKCEGESLLDITNKEIAIIHYTNNTISNFYGEFFHIDLDNDKTVRISIPDLMYHRRTFTGGTASADEMGMVFLASGDSKTIGNSDIVYYDLYEDPTLVNTPNVVGKVFPYLKIVVIDDEEIVAALSYKSNRNWTLPELTATLKNSVSGLANGVLGQNETMYLTYSLQNEILSGLTTPIHCQKYTKITNSTSTTKDVEFKLKDIDLLPYMRKIEDLGYDGRGFYADTFKLLYQIVPNDDDRPNPSQWKEVDFTDTNITGGAGETIDPFLLENQNPNSTGFVLTQTLDSGATIYDLGQILSLAYENTPEVLQFGDERFFYGNLDTYIGASIFKTIFDIRVNTTQFNTTTNPTRDNDPTTNPPNLRVSEIGIYDNNNNLVLIGKLSKPVELTTNSTIMFELSIDF